MNTNNKSPETGVSPETTSTVDKTARQARELIDKLAVLADATARQSIPAAAQAAHKAVDSVAASAAPVETWLSERAGEWNVSQEKLLKEAREFVKENPLTSIGIALAAGVLIGRIIR